MKFSLKFNVLYFLLWSCLFVVPFIICGNLTPLRAVEVFTIIGCCYATGLVLLNCTDFSGSLSTVAQPIISIFTGSLLYSLFLFFIPHQFLFVAILVCTIALVLLSRLQYTVKINGMDFFILGFAALVYFFISGWHLFFSAEPVITNSFYNDPYFFTSCVVSVRQGTLYSAAFETGSSLNYHTLGLFIPALYGELFHISSFQSLWAIAMPFYMAASIVLSYELLGGYFPDRQLFGKKWLFIVVSISLPFILVPLHPLYLLKGDVRNFVFNGIPYLFPGGNVPSTFAICLFYTGFIAFSRINWAEKQGADKLFFVLATAAMAVSKAPFFFEYGVFLAAIVLFRLLRKPGEKIKFYLFYGAGCIALIAVLLKIFSPDPTTVRTNFRFGFLLHRIADLLHLKFAFDAVTLLKLSGITIVILLTWASIRLLGLGSLLVSRDTRFKELAIGSIAAFAAALGLTLFLHIGALDAAGKEVFDATWDVEQFLRVAYYLLTAISMIGVMGLLLAARKKSYTITTVVLLCFWAICSVSARYANYRPESLVHVEWFDQNYKDLKAGHMNGGLILVNPYSEFGCLLSATDYGKYWTAMARGSGLYNNSFKNAYRWDIYKQLLTNPSPDLVKRLKAEGVRYIIATPFDGEAIMNLYNANKDLIKKSDSNPWLYEII